MGFCALLLSVLCFSACSETEEVTMPAGNEPASISFSVNDIQTRLSYDFEHTNFDNGEYIGCVIAEVKDDGSYTYLRNSAWTYRESDNMLLFQYYWGYKIDGNTVSYGPISSMDKEAMGQYNPTENPDKIITREFIDAKDEEENAAYVSSPYLEKTHGKKLKFFFYYPYVDNELLKADYEKVIINNNDYTKLTYPNCATSTTTLPSSSTENTWNSITLIGEVESINQPGYNGESNKYSWKEYPCFVNHTQGDIKTGGNLNDPRLLNSDFLWAGLEENQAVDHTTNRTFSLRFKKKTATILVYSEAQLDDIYFMATGDNTLLRGKKIDISTGELSDYVPSSGWTAFPQQDNRYFKANEHIIPCYRGPHEAEDGDPYYFYRLVLPAQEDCDFKMHIKIAETEIDKDINLSADNKLTELKEGYLYSIRISKEGNTVINIKDWVDADGGELQEVTDTE